MKLTLFLSIPFLLTLNACTSIEKVKPWQRGLLAKPEMTFNNEGLQGTLQQHIYFSKEASSGGSGLGGGGCGCN